MKKHDRNLIIAGVAICLIIAVMAPFIASSNPDGLEKSSEQLGGSESGIYTAPFKDYTIGAFGDSPFASIVALALGVFVALILGYGVSYILKRRKPPEALK